MSWINWRQPEPHELFQNQEGHGALTGTFLTSRSGVVNVEGYYYIRDEHVWARVTPPDAWTHLPEPYRKTT